MIEVGSDLIPVTDPDLGGVLFDKISEMRRCFHYERGMILPPIKIKDDPKLKLMDYRISLYNFLIGKYIFIFDEINIHNSDMNKDIESKYNFDKNILYSTHIINHLYNIIKYYNKYF